MPIGIRNNSYALKYPKGLQPRLRHRRKSAHLAGNVAAGEWAAAAKGIRQSEWIVIRSRLQRGARSRTFPENLGGPGSPEGLAKWQTVAEKRSRQSIEQLAHEAAMSGG